MRNLCGRDTEEDCAANLVNFISSIINIQVSCGGAYQHKVVFHGQFLSKFIS